jgi:hypothetical protein
MLRLCFAKRLVNLDRMEPFVLVPLLLVVVVSTTGGAADSRL